MQIKGGYTKYYVDVDGNYLGGFCGIQQLIGTYDDGEQVIIHERQEPVTPIGAILVPNPPINSLQKWDAVNRVWLALPNNELTKGD